MRSNYVVYYQFFILNTKQKEMGLASNEIKAEQIGSENNKQLLFKFKL